MNISDAINAAADHIEAHPASYAFSQGQVWRDDSGRHGPGGYPSCMLARIGEMAGMPHATCHATVATELLKMSGAEQFYQEVRANAKKSARDPLHNTAVIPGALRKIAKKYEGIPAEVRDIFDAHAQAHRSGQRLMVATSAQDFMAQVHRSISEVFS